MRLSPFVLFMLICLAAGCASYGDASQASPAPSGANAPLDLEYGFRAYRAKDYAQAWQTLNPHANPNSSKANPKALRYTGLMLFRNQAPGNAYSDIQTAQQEGVRRLLSAARRGDNNAMIMLEKLRTQGTANAPTVEQIIEVEKFRARRGDALTAWRLARRYRSGDGVGISVSQSVRWLKIASVADPDEFPYAKDAAYALCEIYANPVNPNTKLARRWCGQAADYGHTAAAITLARLENKTGYAY